MTRGLKIWLWIVIIQNTLFACVTMAVEMMGTISYSVMANAVLMLVVALGAATILFARRKAGFFIICASEAGSVILDLIQGSTLIFSLIPAIVLPLIVWVLMSRTWDQFD